MLFTTLNLTATTSEADSTIEKINDMIGPELEVVFDFRQCEYVIVMSIE